MLVIVVLLAGSAMFWWFGAGQPDPVYALISRLPQPAADLVTVAAEKSGYRPPQAASTALDTAGGSPSQSVVPEPELIVSPQSGIEVAAGGNREEAGEPSVTVTTTGAREELESPPQLAGTVGVNLKLDPSMRFRSLPRIKSALFSESRRLVVYFPLDEYELTPPAQEALTQLAASLAEARQLFTLRIDGHCDDTGDDAYNQQLSVRRAQAVKDFLLARGLTADSTQLRGFGERIPVVAGADTHSRARNRRAEIWVEWVESRAAEAPKSLESAD